MSKKKPDTVDHNIKTSAAASSLIGDTATTYHVPAMLEECMDGLALRPDGTYIDVTFGGGGHSREILRRLGEAGRLYSFDQDMDAYANRIEGDERWTFVHGNFRYLANFMRYYGVEAADGILADLGVSFHHFDAAERGFSFRDDAPLDMRMNRKGYLTADEVVNSYDEAALTRILADYGDLKRAKAFAAKIVSQRSHEPIRTTGQLLDAVKSLVNPRQEKKELAQVFQALRIEVNGEMSALAEFLQSTERVLRPGGRLVVLTYHSLEDRMVKNFMRAGNVAGEVEKDLVYGHTQSRWKVITRSVITPSSEEITRNPRARSAKLRVAEYLGKEADND